MSPSPVRPPVDILLVEDNEGDIELTRIAFETEEMPIRLWVAHDGVEAVDCVFKRGAFQNAPTPNLILLDINMPRMDGLEFLKIVKQDERLKIIPVIMLTSSNAQSDILESYRRHANSYILKPRSMKESIHVAQQVKSFWISLAQLPPAAEPA